MCFFRSLAKYLLRDGSRVTVTSAPAVFDVLSYTKLSGQEVHAALSIKAERAILKSVALEQLVETTDSDPLRCKAAVA